MISTMPKSGQAPSSPNAMPGGLGAILQQPGGAPKGASSRSMQQMVDTARKMSDMQLADVLAGKSLDVPQYVAMTEAMGRKSLRTAMQGAQAQQQARQPSVKDKLLAEEAAAQMPQQVAGLDQLPAPNMESVDMAGGGIVAFQDRGLVEDTDPLGSYQTPAPSGFDKRLWEAIKEKFGEWNQPWGKTVNATPAEIRGALTGKNVKKEATTPTIESTPSQAEIDAIRATNVPTGGVNFDPTAGGTYKPGAAPAAKKSGIAAILDGETEPKKAADDYLAKLAGIGEKTRSGIAGLKNEAQSQMLFDAMSALMGNRNIAEAGSKFGQLAAGRLSSMGKEQRALEKEANDYDLNLARYREAVASGDKDRALQAQKMMLENQYHMAMVNKPGETMQVLNAIRQPGESMADAFARYNTGKKAADVIPRATALKEYNDLIGDVTNRDFKKRYPTFQSYYNDLTGGSGGGGASVKFLGFEK